MEKRGKGKKKREEFDGGLHKKRKEKKGNKGKKAEKGKKEKKEKKRGVMVLKGENYHKFVSLFMYNSDRFR